MMGEINSVLSNASDVPVAIEAFCLVGLGKERFPL